MVSASRNNGLRPQASAFVPTRMAIGTITIWAATMHADIRLVPRFLFSNASFWPTKGNIAAFAK